jgi:cardiolipin synthase
MPRKLRRKIAAKPAQRAPQRAPHRAAPRGKEILASLRKAYDSIMNRFAVWELMLLGFGAVALVSILVVLFAPFGDGPELIHTTGPVPPAGSDAFVAELSDVMTLPVALAPRPTVLNNGDAFLSRLIIDIDGAKRSIDFMVYIWDDGRFSDKVLSHLTARAKAGVPVRIALDAFGAASAPDDKLDDFRKAGGRVATFHSLMPLPWAMARDHKRNHRRAIVIDGDVAYTGGIAVSDTWLGNARNDKEWRDVMFRVEGAMARHLQSAFAEVWEGATGEILAGDAFYPQDFSAPGMRVKYVPFPSSPSPDVFAMESFVLLSLEGARKSITIVSPYFLPDASLRAALEKKARAGVAVNVLVPNHYNDNRWVRYASQEIYEELLAAGVKIREFQPTFIHTKLMIVDGLWSVIGSANMDNRSRKLNDEVVMGIADADFAKALETLVAGDVARSAPVELAKWRERGLWQRAMERVALVTVQQY